MGTVLALLGTLSLAFSITSTFAFDGAMSISSALLAVALSAMTLFWPYKHSQVAEKVARLSSVVLRAAIIFLAFLFLWKFGPLKVFAMLFFFLVFGLPALSPLFGITSKEMVLE